MTLMHQSTNGSPAAAHPAWLAEHVRAIDPAVRERFEGYLSEILGSLGMDLDEPGTSDTPRRLLQALIDATDGYEGDPKLVTVFPTECHGDASCELAQVVEGPIPFFALCEHHALPFFGQAYVGYVAHDQIIGISKLTRLVRVLTRRFGVQERMTHQIAESLAELLNAHGVAVYMEAEHLCTQMRGVRENNATTRTTAYRGVYETDAHLRSEFFTVGGIGRGAAR
jgi:GTP cyclohydrolase I